MRGVGFAVFLVVAAGLGLKAYTNAGVPHPVDEQARAVACQEISTCADGQPTTIDTTAFVRRYVFAASGGDVEVECRWALVMFGEVECKGTVRKEVAPTQNGRYPHEIKRGAPPK